MTRGGRACGLRQPRALLSAIRVASRLQPRKRYIWHEICTLTLKVCISVICIPPGKARGHTYASLSDQLPSTLTLVRWTRGAYHNSSVGLPLSPYDVLAITDAHTDPKLISESEDNRHCFDFSHIPSTVCLARQITDDSALSKAMLFLTRRCRAQSARS